MGYHCQSAHAAPPAATDISAPDPDPAIPALVLDEAGRVLSANEAACALLDGPEDALLGRDLFRDVEPALNSPACRGRFLDLVRGVATPAAVTLVLGRVAGSLLLRVAFERLPSGAVRATLDTLGALRPSRHREAMLAVDQRSRAEPVDPLVCEREPIQIPGTIQPPNGLLALDPETFVVAVASETIGELLGLDGPVVGQPLDALLPARAVSDMRAALADGSVPHGPPIRRNAIMGREARPFDYLLHIHDERLIVEIEAAPRFPGDFDVPPHALIRETVSALRRAADLPALLGQAAKRLQALSGYERLLIYRFDAEWNGEAVGEALAGGWDESLLGIRFPASDIPRQARELYTRSPARFVVDRDAAPIALLSSPDENRPLDMTFAAFRSVSPVHVEYQRNLGVNGSMSIAIMVDGHLWGLVIGHHRRPHYLAPETRDALVVVTDALALGIEDQEAQSRAAEQDRYLTAQRALLEQMAAADDVPSALTGDTRLSDLFKASGAAVLMGEDVTLIGATLPAADVVALVREVRASTLGATFAIDQLSTVVPAMAEHGAIASGMLVAFASEDRDLALVWFRPEQVQTVLWGGDPSKPVLAHGPSAAVLPRRSFERWVETVRGRSEPWAPWMIGVARTLARAVESMAIRTSRRVRELSRKQDDLVAALAQKDALLDQKDLLTREIDHRVKNSLQIVSAFLRMQARQVTDPDAQAAFNHSYGRVMSIARVHDSLYQSDTVTEVDLGQTVENLCRDLSEMTGEGREIAIEAERGLMVPYRKAVALCLIATELVTNAWKYAYGGSTEGRVEVKVGRGEAGGLELVVADEGLGMPSDWSSSRKGLGMQLIRAMLAQIDATMDVVNAPGAQVTVRC